MGASDPEAGRQADPSDAANMSKEDEARGDAVAKKCPSGEVSPKFSNGKWNFPCVPARDRSKKKKSKYSKGAKGRDPKVGRELMKKMKAAAPKGNWKKLKYSHPARVAYRAWYKGEPIPGQATAGEQAPIDNKQLAKLVSWVKEDPTGKRTNMVIKIAKSPSNPNRNKAMAILKALSG